MENLSSNEIKAQEIANQCRPCSDDFYSGIYQGVLLTLKAEESALNKAKKWDDLDDKISKFYPEDVDEDDDSGDEGGGDLCDIGELAATAFGYF